MFTEETDLYDPDTGKAPTDINSIACAWVAVDPIHPGGCNRENRDIKQTRYALKRYILQHHDKPQAFWEVFNAVYMPYSSKGASLSQDSWSGQLYLGATATTADELLSKLEDVLGIVCKLSSADFYRKLAVRLKWSQFSPVKRYLQALPEPTSEDWEIWKTLANTLFGTSGDLSQTYLQKWLISAVARVMKPGCKADSALVIKGKQGIGKTSFLAALFGDHFRTLHSFQSALEQQRIMQQAWAIELGEIEATFRSKDISALKALMSATHDDYRDPYQKAPESRPRHLVYAGTTNESAFLNDPTGNRRFWVVDAANHKIPVAWVEENRDRVWAVAKHLWEDGQQHFLSQEEEELSELSNKAYATENPLEESLRVALEFFEDNYKDICDSIAIRASDAMEHLLGIRKENYKRHEKDLAAAMTAIGYTRKKFASKALNGWFYVRPDATKPLAFDLSMLRQLEAYRHNPERLDRKRS